MHSLILKLAEEAAVVVVYFSEDKVLCGFCGFQEYE